MSTYFRPLPPKLSIMKLPITNKKHPTKYIIASTSPTRGINIIRELSRKIFNVIDLTQFQSRYHPLFTTTITSSENQTLSLTLSKKHWKYTKASRLVKKPYFFIPLNTLYFPQNESSICLLFIEGFRMFLFRFVRNLFCNKTNAFLGKLKTCVESIGTFLCYLLYRK